MVFKKEDDVFSAIRRQASKSDEDIVEKRELIFQGISSHPWKLITAVDYDGSPILRTKDEKDPDDPFKRFPSEREYLKHLVFTMMDPEITMLWVSKNRQIMASHTAAIVSLWKIHNLPAQNIFFSRIRQKDSIKLLRDKVRQTHILLPKWLKERWTLTPEPKDLATSGLGSMITAVPQTFATGEGRGDSASEVIVDEYAYQDHLVEIITAGISMAKRMTFISTPNGTTLGGQLGIKYIKRAKDNAVRIDNPCEGLNIIRAKNAEGSAMMCVFEVIHKSEEQSKKGWLYVNDSSRRQEEELSTTHTDGSAYFPETEIYGGRDAYSQECTELNYNLPIDCGYDFGVMRPAIVCGQVDPVKVRIHVVRAYLGKDIDPDSFAALSKYLMGQMPIGELGQFVPAIHALNDLKQQQPNIRTPWFNADNGPKFKFRHWGGHEAARAIATGPGQKLQTFAQIFDTYGININPMWVPKERREFILRHLLRPRKEDNRPSILFDPEGAAIALDGIISGLVRPYNSKSKENKTEEPMDDHYYKDVYDALGYILVNVFSHVDWNSIETVHKVYVRESKAFDQIVRMPRWGESKGRKPLLTPQRY